jgi:hypothetical protein
LTAPGDCENDYQVRLFHPRAALLLLLAVGCAGQLPPPTEADALRASARFPGTTVASLAHGQKLYVERCSSCHALPLPHHKSPDAWPKLVDEMKERSRMSDATAQEISRYLVIASAAPR